MKKKLLLLFVLVAALTKTFSQTTPFIYTDTVTPVINLAYTEAENNIYINSDEAILPVSRTITVPFRTSGTFNSGNVFNIVLSDTSGNFGTPSSRIIGTLSASGNVGNRTVDVVIPYSQLNSSNEYLLFDTIPSSFDYRVRVESTDPVLIGSPNATSLTLGTPNIMVAIVNEQDENMTAQDMSAVIDWLQKTIVDKNTPYCWKKTTTRNVAPPPNDIPDKCSDGYTKNGLLCYINCQSGYYNIAGVCWQSCPNGWIDAGITCFPSSSTVSTPSLLGDCPSEYDNTGIECYRFVVSISHPSQLASCPSGYTNTGITCYVPWSFPIVDFPLSDSRATCPSGYFKGFANRCYYNCGSGWINDGDFCRRPDDHVSYANGMYCPAGYEPKSDFAFGRCYQRCEQGWHSTLEFCQADVLSLTKNSYVVSPTLMGCNTGWVYDAGLCYPKCPNGSDGVGPVCWAKCGANMIECGAGCATDLTACISTITDQVVSSVLLVISIASAAYGAPGPGKAIQTTVNGVTKVAKVVATTAKSSKSLIFVAYKLKQASKAATNAVSIVNRVKVAYAKIKPAVDRIKEIKKAYETVSKSVGIANASYEIATRDGLVNDFGVDINNQLNAHFNKTAYNQIAQMWAKLKFNKFAANLGIDIASQALQAISLAGMAEPYGIVSGVADVALAYTKPICGSSNIFPALSKNYK